MIWYLPTLYGDIRLETKDRSTRVCFEKLSPEETKALGILLNHAVKKGWTTETTCKPFQAMLGSLIETEQEIVLQAKISDVQKVLSHPLKPGRKMVSAVRFSGGAIEEVTTAHLAVIDTAAEVVSEKEEPVRRKKPTVAATVAAPKVGCPAPAFERAELRATRVLEAFLTPGQLHDFRTTNSFVAMGADSGHNYMIVSRHAKTTLHHTARSLYDLDERFPICVHDWSVPAAEEMLALFLMVSLPGKESFVRWLPDDGQEFMLGPDDPFPEHVLPLAVPRAIERNS